jgi:hypothetical protein
VAPEDRASAHGSALTAVKAIHTLAWFSIESCMVLLYAAFVKWTDRRAAVSAVVVGGESLISPRTGSVTR